MQHEWWNVACGGGAQVYNLCGQRQSLPRMGRNGLPPAAQMANLCSALSAAPAFGQSDCANRDHPSQLMNPLILSLIFAVGPALSLLANPIPSIEGATPEMVLGGAENLAIVAHAREVTVFRIAQGNEKKGKLIMIDGYQCKAAPKAVSGPEVGKVGAALSDVANFASGKMCDFDPGVILRFRSESAILDFVVCFRCHEMISYRDGAVVRRDVQWVGRKIGFRRDVDAAFRALAKKAFPDDPAIKALRP